MNYTYPMMVIRDFAGVFHRNGSWSDLFKELTRVLRDEFLSSNKQSDVRRRLSIKLSYTATPQLYLSIIPGSSTNLTNPYETIQLVFGKYSSFNARRMYNLQNSSASSVLRSSSPL